MNLLNILLWGMILLGIYLIYSAIQTANQIEREKKK